MSETKPRTRAGRRSVLLAGAAVAAITGAAAIYEITGRSSNADAGVCAQAVARAETLGPLATGEVAAMMVAEEPMRLPDIAFTDADGAERKLSDWRGRTVLLNLWATWCAPCRYEMPALDRLEAEMGGEAFEVVAVSIDSGDTAKARDFLEEIEVERLGFYADPSGGVFRNLKAVGRAFGMPTTLIVDAEGCELGHLAGPAEWDSPDALAIIRASIADG